MLGTADLLLRCDEERTNEQLVDPFERIVGIPGSFAGQRGFRFTVPATRSTPVCDIFEGKKLYLPSLA